MQEKLDQLVAKIEADENLAVKMFTLDTPEEVQNLLKGEGIDFSLEEILLIKEAVVKSSVQGAANGELSEDDLENVAGGSSINIVPIIGPGIIRPGIIEPTFPGRRW